MWVTAAAAAVVVAAATAAAGHPGSPHAEGPYTSEFGTLVGDDRNTLSAGPRGPQLVQDTRAFEKLARFNRTFRCLPGGVERRGGRGGGQAWLGVALRWLGCRKPV